jgi:hypothetical protein
LRRVDSRHVEFPAGNRVRHERGEKASPAAFALFFHAGSLLAAVSALNRLSRKALAGAGAEERLMAAGNSIVTP